MTAALPLLFAATLFVSASLLFAVQPMAARMVLPLLGGSPAVWTTCVLFFQTVLLAGYAYAHLTARRLGVRRQAAVHAALLLACLFALPFAPPGADALGTSGRETAGGPAWGLLEWLVRTTALPVFAVAATAPLLQGWYAALGLPSSRDPYFLYASSNAGSLAALLAYPFWVERRLRLGEQSLWWGRGVLVLAGMVGLCALVARARGRAPGDEAAGGFSATGRDWAAWLTLALIPSSLMLGVTTYLTTDLASVPLLWVVPLGLYLLSFVLVFGRRGDRAAAAAGRLLPWLVVAQAPVMGAGLVQPFWIPLHLLTFFAAAVVCHGELARRRPPPQGLTAFYLAAAAGGALGGVFNAVVAPAVFDRVEEYPIALVAACLVLAGGWRRFGRRDLGLPLAVGLTASALCADLGGLSESVPGVAATMLAAGLSVLAAATHRARPARFALTVGAWFVASGFAAGVGGRVIDRERGFFGTLRVTEVAPGPVHRLFHGSTLHGQQNLDPAHRREPSTYFDRAGPIGRVFEVFEARTGRGRGRVAVTGLGVGALAAYAKTGQRWRFYEIDPAVVRVARDPRFFTFLSDCPAGEPEIVVGDARVAMARGDDGAFDLIVLDAFSSDAIPVHLLDREALALDLRKLAPGGLIVVNITNRYLDLAPVVARLAADAGLACRARVDPVADRATGKQGSIWAALARREADLGALAADPDWFTPAPTPGDPVWTDDFANPLAHFRFGRVVTPASGR